MEKTEIRAVKLTRRIRAAHAEQLRGASVEERIRFYRSKARYLAAEIQPFLEEAEAANSGAVQQANVGDDPAP
ncbi:hypothetical protein BH23GEM5_BH23GEM5_23010 [soil metagenome]